MSSPPEPQQTTLTPPQAAPQPGRGKESRAKVTISLQVLIPSLPKPRDLGSPLDQGEQQPQESSKRSLSCLETSNQPIPAFSLHPRGRGDSWLADVWRQHFIDFCVGCRRDLIGTWRFLTPVSGSQQGWCWERQPRLSHPLPNSVSCWECACGKGRFLPETCACSY